MQYSPSVPSSGILERSMVLSTGVGGIDDEETRLVVDVGATK